ncbi:MAG: TIM barrel protein [Candidatus Eremiobacteraeota bacterium]|nr:TIM barrel protein [Candidatus Eremiobacteraeota bacterium]
MEQSQHMAPIGVGMIQQWLRSLEPEPLLETVKAEGADFIEMYLTHKEWERRLSWLRLAKSLSLGYTFHGPYHGEYELSRFEDREDNGVRKAFLALLEQAAAETWDNGITSRINIHGASSSEFTRGHLFGITLSFLTWLARERERRRWPFDFVVELLPHDTDKEKTGDCVEDLVALRRELGDTIAGFCWDMGHYRRNELLGFDSSLESSFIEKVRHVHVHDIKDIKEDFDHCPLDFGTVPYESYLGMLRGNPLRIVLELNYSHTLTCGDPVKGLTGSLGKIRAARDSLGLMEI